MLRVAAVQERRVLSQGDGRMQLWAQVLRYHRDESKRRVLVQLRRALGVWPLRIYSWEEMSSQCGLFITNACHVCRST